MPTATTVPIHLSTTVKSLRGLACEAYETTRVVPVVLLGSEP
jgi:hypothetical protein